MGDCIGNEFKSAGEFWIGEYVVESKGFEIIRWFGNCDRACSISIAHWFLALLSTILPLLGLRSHRRGVPGHCLVFFFSGGDYMP